MRAYRTLLVAVVAVLATLVVRANLPIQVASGGWAASGQMSAVRAGAASVLMDDGRILVTGGFDANGNPLATTEFFNSDGTFTAGPMLTTPRAGHAALLLLNGDVIVTGGTIDAKGSVTNTAEIYDPLNGGAWATLPSTMIEARSGQTMTQLQDGSVLIAGGMDSSGTALSALETLQIAPSEHFVSAGALQTGRRNQAAAALLDGRVLIVGGTDASGATLSSIEIYDPTTGAVTSSTAMSTPRTSASATTLLDGTVLIAGGSYPEAVTQTNPDGTTLLTGPAELASMEIYSPVAGTIASYGASMSTPRSGHQAFLLPNNNNVLLVGGSYNGQPLASVDLYTPWTGQLAANSSMSNARIQATGSALGGPVGSNVSGTDGLLLVAGGTNQSSAELYGFATVKTDKMDYAPGETVTITGSGWQPGETVNLSVRDLPTSGGAVEYKFTSVADSSGSITNSQYSPASSDVGSRYYVTAVGAVSQAQNTFTDANSLRIKPGDFAFTSPAGATDGTVDASQGNLTLTVKISDQSGGGQSWTNVSAVLTPAPGWTVTGGLTQSGGSIPTNGSTSFSWTVTAPSTAGNGSFSVSVSGTPASGGCSGSNKCSDTATSSMTAVAPAALTMQTVTATPSANPANASSTISVSMNVKNTGGAGVTNAAPALTVNSIGAGAPSATCTLVTSPAPPTKVNPGATATYSYNCNSLTGAGTLTFTGSTSGTDENTGATVSSGSLTSNSVTLDAVPPTVTITSNPSNPTNSTSASFSFSGADNVTPTGSLDYKCKLDAGAFTACTSPQTYSGLSFASHTFQVESVDQAGNVSTPASYTWSVVADNTPPAVTVTLSSTPDGLNGWYKSSAVTGTVTADDTNTGGSSIKTISCTGASVGSITVLSTTSASAQLSVSAEGTNSISCTATDSANNTGAAPGSSNTATVKIDTTAPTLTAGSCTGTKGNSVNGTQWYLSAVSCGFTASDTTSGLADSSKGSFNVTSGTNEGAALYIASGQVCDMAGNCATSINSGPFAIELTGPQIGFGSQSPAANGYGWNNTNVSFAYSVSNSPVSGIDSVKSTPSPIVISAEGSGETGSATVYTVAGNSASANTPAVNIDKTKPMITAGTCTGTKGNLVGATQWYLSAVSCGFTANDALSGLADSSKSAFNATSGTNEGTAISVASGQVCDKAGNCADSVSSGPFAIELTGPQIAFGSQSPAANGYGWNNTNVSFTYSVSNSPVSGIDSVKSTPSPVVISAEGSGETGSATVYTVAGNSATANTPAVNIDKTPPAVTCPSPMPVFILNQPNVAVMAQVTDALSGPVSPSVSSSVTDPSVGTFTVSLTGLDKAGNSTTKSCSYAVNFGSAVGFFQPWAAPPGTAFKAGSTIPLKWQWTDYYGKVVDSGSVLANVYQHAWCPSSPSTLDVIDITDAGSSGYQYDPTTFTWQYNWKTPKNGGGLCYEINVKANNAGGFVDGDKPTQLR